MPIWKERLYRYCFKYIGANIKIAIFEIIVQFKKLNFILATSFFLFGHAAFLTFSILVAGEVDAGKLSHTIM